MPARTVSRILRRHDVARLCTTDPLTGEVIRSSKATASRYERERPASWSTWTSRRSAGSPTVAAGALTAAGWVRPQRRRRRRSATTTSTRSSMTTAGWRTPRSSTTKGPDLRRVHRPRRRLLRRRGDHPHRTGDDRQPLELQELQRRRRRADQLGATHKFIRPHCPWQNGKVERFNRTLATEWAYRQVFTTNAERTAALPPCLDHYNHQRRHTAIGGHPPISRLSPT